MSCDTCHGEDGTKFISRSSSTCRVRFRLVILISRFDSVTAVSVPPHAPSTAPAIAGAAGPTARTAKGRRLIEGLPVTLLLTVLTVINVLGAPYYLAPSTARPRHEWHAFLKPSGTVGQTAGILAFVIFVFLWLYPLRKKWRALAFTGAIGRWLDVHVTTALGLPLLLTIHAAWRADGVIGLGFGAMLVVCASGVVGRYLYVRIPRAKNGTELTREEVAGERDATVRELATALGLSVEAVRADITPPTAARGTSVLAVLEGLLLDDWRRWRHTHALASRWRQRGGVSRRDIRRAVSLASREMALADQVRMLEATQRVFRYWHIAHKPFALTALLAVTIHVIIVVAMGTTWFW